MHPLHCISEGAHESNGKVPISSLWFIVTHESLPSTATSSDQNRKSTTAREESPCQYDPLLYCEPQAISA